MNGEVTERGHRFPQKKQKNADSAHFQKARGSSPAEKAGTRRPAEKSGNHRPASGRSSSGVTVLYEDRQLLVVYKPEGLLTVPYEGFKGKTLIGVLEEMRRKRGLVHGSFKPYAVHRLDRETSGVMIVALTPDAQKRIMDSWQTMVIHRKYRALAEVPRNGLTLADEGTIDAPLTKNAAHHSYVAGNSRQKAHAAPNEVEAITHYRIIQKGKKYALFELELETGRTNQIRAHLASTGCPIAGDRLYRAHTDPDGRMCLHAVSIEFIHPYTRQQLSFQMPEPEAWLKLTALP